MEDVAGVLCGADRQAARWRGVFLPATCRLVKAAACHRSPQGRAYTDDAGEIHVRVNVAGELHGAGFTGETTEPVVDGEEQAGAGEA